MVRIAACELRGVARSIVSEQMQEAEGVNAERIMIARKNPLKPSRELSLFQS